MTMNVYTLKDVISNQTLLLGMAPTDGAFVRDTHADGTQNKSEQPYHGQKRHQWVPYPIKEFDLRLHL